MTKELGEFHGRLIVDVSGDDGFESQHASGDKFGHLIGREEQGGWFGACAHSAVVPPPPAEPAVTDELCFNYRGVFSSHRLTKTAVDPEFKHRKNLK